MRHSFVYENMVLEASPKFSWRMVGIGNVFLSLVPRHLSWQLDVRSPISLTWPVIQIISDPWEIRNCCHSYCHRLQEKCKKPVNRSLYVSAMYFRLTTGVDVSKQQKSLRRAGAV